MKERALEQECVLEKECVLEERRGGGREADAHPSWTIWVWLPSSFVSSDGCLEQQPWREGTSARSGQTPTSGRGEEEKPRWRSLRLTRRWMDG